MRKARQWIGLAIVTLVVLGMGITAKAETTPSEFFWTEFWIGEMYAIGGGALGFLMYASIDRLIYADPSSSTCSLKECLIGLLALNLGRALGASLGVVNAGSTWGVDGNIWGAYLATGLWYVSPFLLRRLGVAVDETFMLVPGIPAALATIGYNIGAKMKSDKSKPAALSWQLPLVALKF